MGAVAVTVSEVSVQGNKRVVYGTLALSSAYAAGGDTWTPANFGLSVVDRLQVEPGGGIEPSPDRANKKIKAFWTGAGLSAVLAEVTDGTDLHATSLDFKAEGA